MQHHSFIICQPASPYAFGHPLQVCVSKFVFPTCDDYVSPFRLGLTVPTHNKLRVCKLLLTGTGWRKNAAKTVGKMLALFPSKSLNCSAACTQTNLYFLTLGGKGHLCEGVLTQFILFNQYCDLINNFVFLSIVATEKARQRTDTLSWFECQ